MAEPFAYAGTTFGCNGTTVTVSMRFANRDQALKLYDEMMQRMAEGKEVPLLIQATGPIKSETLQ